MKILSVFFAAAALWGCRIALGNLDDPDCRDKPTDTDCGEPSENRACDQGQCLPRPYYKVDPRCTTLGHPDGSYAIAAIIPRTFPSGETNPEAFTQHETLALAVEKFNPPAGPGLHGHHLTVYSCDPEAPVEASEDLMAHLLEKRAVKAFITIDDDDTITVGEQTQDAGSLVLSIASTTQDIGQFGDRIWRMGTNAVSEGAVLGRLFGDAGFGRLSVVAEATSYGAGVAAGAISTFGDGGAHFPFETGDIVSRQQAWYSAIAHMGNDAGIPAISGLIGSKSDMALGVGSFTGHRGRDRSLLESAADAGVSFAGVIGASPVVIDTQGAAYRYLVIRLAERGVDAGTFAETLVPQTWDAIALLFFAGHYATGANRSFDGPTLGTGLSKLSAGPSPHPLIPASFAEGQALTELDTNGQIDVLGASGPINFSATREASYPYEVWFVDGGIALDGKLAPGTDFQTLEVVFP